MATNGENVGSGVTISGTVGATLEGASFGILGLALSLQTDPQYHLSPPDGVGFSGAALFTRQFPARPLSLGPPQHMGRVSGGEVAGAGGGRTDRRGACGLDAVPRRYRREGRGGGGVAA